MPHGWTRYFRSARYILLGLPLACALLAAFLGCDAQQNHRVLTFFFDGVPDLDAPPRPLHRALVRAAARMPSSTNPGQTSIPVVSVHKAYSDNLCDACHRNAAGEIADFNQVTAATCYKCHRRVATEYAFMHGPVAVGACLTCHQPHESAQVHLLRDQPRTLCTSCHDAALLGDKPQEHRDPNMNCLDCHSGHGGKKLPFLKPRPASSQPATVPATAPSPTTAPGPKVLHASANLPAEAPL